MFKKSTIILLALLFIAPASFANTDLGMRLLAARKYNAAATALWPDAKAGNPEAQYNWVVASYFSADKTFSLYPKMAKMLHASAEHGNAFAMMRLGVKPECKWMNTCDNYMSWRKKAINRWLEQAKQGNAEAQYRLATFRTGDTVEWYKKALKMGSEKAGIQLYRYLIRNDNGEEKKPNQLSNSERKKAIEYLTTASDRNYAPAMVELSKIYFATPTKKNIDLGFEWLKKAANLNYPDAIGLMGSSLLRPKLGHLDQDKAFFYNYISYTWGSPIKSYVTFNKKSDFKRIKDISSKLGMELKYIPPKKEEEIKQQADQWLKGRLPNYFDGPFPGNFIH